MEDVQASEEVNYSSTQCYDRDGSHTGHGAKLARRATVIQ